MIQPFFMYIQTEERGEIPMELFKLFGTIAISNSEANDAIDETTGKAASAQKKLGSVFGTVGKIALGAGKVIAAGIGATATAFTALGASAVKYNAEMEQYNTSFEVMLGSEEKALALVADLKEKAAKTPFEMSDLANTTQLLLNYGLTAEQATEKMMMLGDIAQGDAEKMGRVANAYGQMSSAGKVSLEDVKQMIEAGFNPLQEISESTGESMESLYDRISKGTISVDEITASMTRATSEGGKYFQSMEKQSQTFSGRLSTLKDTIDSKLGEAFAGVSDILSEKVLPLFTTLAEKYIPKLGGVVEQILPPVTTMAEAALPLILDTVESLLPMFVQIVQNILPLMVSIMGSVLPIVIQLVSTVLPILIKVLEMIMPSLSQIISTLLPALLEIIMPILELLTPIIQLLQPILDLVVALLSPIMQILGILKPIIQLVLGVLTPIIALINEALTPLVDAVMLVVNTLLDALMPILDVLISLVGAVLQPVLAALMPILSTLLMALTPILEMVAVLLSELLIPLIPVIEWLANVIATTLGNSITAFLPMIESLMDIFVNLLDFIIGVFTGDWEKAWNGIVNMFKGIVNLIPEYFEAIMNNLIGMINGVIEGINSVGGKIGFDLLPTIPNLDLPPLLEEGGVLEKGQMGFLEGNGAEAVVPLHNNRKWIANVAKDMQSQGIGSEGIDYDKLTQCFVKALQTVAPELRSNVTVEGDAKGMFKTIQKQAKVFKDTTGQGAFA